MDAHSLALLRIGAADPGIRLPADLFPCHHTPSTTRVRAHAHTYTLRTDTHACTLRGGVLPSKLVMVLGPFHPGDFVCTPEGGGKRFNGRCQASQEPLSHLGAGGG